jgi:hypothetical protein
MGWWRIGKRDADLERELRSDLELEEEEQRENGLPPEEARYAAKRAFGNPGLIREQTRAVWSWNWMESFARDLRYGIRTLSRAPGFTFVAVVVIALGIGANVALFTVVRSVLLKPLPFRDSDRLVLMYEYEPDKPHHTPWVGGCGQLLGLAARHTIHSANGDGVALPGIHRFQRGRQAARTGGCGLVHGQLSVSAGCAASAGAGLYCR